VAGADAQAGGILGEDPSGEDGPVVKENLFRKLGRFLFDPLRMGQPFLFLLLSITILEFFVNIFSWPNHDDQDFQILFEYAVHDSVFNTPVSEVERP
jgi:hypothetical protein